MAFMEFLKFPTRSTFPAIGDKNRLYIDLRSKKIYYWDQGAYKIASPDITEQESNPISGAFSYTWESLKALRDAGDLVPGAHYRITDFVTTTAQADTQSAGHAFDLIVTADDVDKLNEQARAIQHAEDIYFANSKLEAWQVWYSLDNDTARFAWADDVNGKGVIYRLIDEFNNDCPYDFKNIQYQARESIMFNEYEESNKFTRYQPDDYVLSDVTYYCFKRADSTTKIWTITLLLTIGMTVYDNAGNVHSPSGGRGVVSYDLSNFDRCYTFSKSKVLVEDADMSLQGILYACYNNQIRPYTKSSQMLNAIVFIGFSNNKLSVYGNTFGNECCSNTFGYDCTFNTFGNGCTFNTFGNGCYSNTFGNECRSNTFGNGCTFNTFGIGCYYNTFGNNCYSNTFGNECRSNTFGTYCYFNTFGIGCYYNTFGNDCYSNTFGNECRSNTFGIYCYFNTFGIGCYYNTFGDDCYSNTFGNECRSNTFGNSCTFNTFGIGCYYNTFCDDCYSNTFGIDCRYLKISDAALVQKRYISVENGTRGASSANQLDLYDAAILNNDYQVTFKQSATGKYLMLWATDTGAMTGKYKALNTDLTWTYLGE